MGNLEFGLQQEENDVTKASEVIPPKKESFFKRHWLKMLLTALLIGVTVFAGIQTYYVNRYRTIALDNKNLYLGENKKSTTLQTELEKTEEGRKVLENVNQNLQNENEKLDKRADTAEQELSKIQKELSVKKKELDEINSQITTMNKELDTKKAEISKLNNGISKFAELETLIDQFEAANLTYIENIDKCISNVNNYMETLNEYYLNQANNYLDNARSQYSVMSSTSDKMQEIFEAIKSGNY